jgi:cell division protein ZapA (FtsZ GTPase activity inhibitor)
MPEATDEKKQVRVTILGQSFTLVTTGDPRETEKLAAEVDELMNSIAVRSQNLDSTRVAVLASMHLADRLRAAEAELKGISDRVQVKARALNELLDQLRKE